MVWRLLNLTKSTKVMKNGMRDAVDDTDSDTPSTAIADFIDMLIDLSMLDLSGLCSYVLFCSDKSAA